MPYGQHWYSINDGILYPLDEQASSKDDSGKLMPTNLLVDLSMRWPSDLGQYAFLSAIAVTSSLVTLVIQSADNLGDPGYSPLAILSVPQPIVPGMVYPLTAQIPGVGGWVVFGAGPSERRPYSGRFSTPRQSRLAPRAARPYRRLPVTSLSAINASTKLSDVVTLTADPPLSIAKEQREIDGVLRDVLVVSLVDSAASSFAVPAALAAQAGIATESVYEQYAGPCGGRPESGTCGDPQPIEFIDAVGPDCTGLLIIKFEGCAQISQILDRCGVVIDCGIGLANSCLPPLLPDSDGRLPSDYVPSQLPTPPSPPVPPPVPTFSDSLSIGTALPYLNCMDPTDAETLQVVSGAWTSTAEGTDPERPSACHGAAALSISALVTEWCYDSASAAVRNIALWTGDVSTIYRRVTLDLFFLAGPSGAKHNGGAVLNFRPHATVSGLFVYYIAEIDYESQALNITHFDGLGFTVVATLFLPGVALGRWYRIQATVLRGSTPDETDIFATAFDLLIPAITATVSATVTDYRPSDGDMGIGCNRSLTRFSFLQVEEAL